MTERHDEIVNLLEQIADSHGSIIDNYISVFDPPKDINHEFSVLYDVMEHGYEAGCWDCSENSDKWFITTSSGDDLHIGDTITVGSSVEYKIIGLGDEKVYCRSENSDKICEFPSYSVHKLYFDTVDDVIEDMAKIIVDAYGTHKTEAKRSASEFVDRLNKINDRSKE